MPQRAADLLRKFVMQPVDQVADMVQHIAHVQTLTAAKAGVENLLEILAATDDYVIIRQRAMTQVMDVLLECVGS